MSLVAQFLRHGGTVADLTAQYAIQATWGIRYPHLVSLKYNQVDSPLGEPLVQECRGIILDSADGWRVVARPFDKFFNHGEGHAAPIDWTTARVQEKVDGSLCIVYWYDGAWRVGTTGTPEASGPVGATWAGTFADLFWHAARAQGVRLHGGAATTLTWLFELTSPHNRIVVPHDHAQLTLLGARDPASGQELRLTPALLDLVGVGVPAVREYPLPTLEAVLASFPTFSPLAQEGYVVVDAAWHRVKVKHPGYVALHQVKDRFTYRTALDVIRRGESGELLAAFPALYHDFQAWQAQYERLVARIEAEYTLIRDCATQKEFAGHATQGLCPAALFALRSGKAPTARAFLATATLDAVCRWVDAV